MTNATRLLALSERDFEPSRELPAGIAPLVARTHDDVEVYDPAADRRRPLARMSSGRYGI